MLYITKADKCLLLLIYRYTFMSETFLYKIPLHVVENSSLLFLV